MFFKGPASDFILSVKGRIGLVVLFLAVLIPLIVSASTLEPNQSAEQFFSEDHPFQYSITIINNEFPASVDDLNLEVFFTWGVDDIDRQVLCCGFWCGLWCVLVCVCVNMIGSPV